MQLLANTAWFTATLNGRTGFQVYSFSGQEAVSQPYAFWLEVVHSRHNENRGIKSYDAIWFPIDYGDQSHYIHVGNLSHGCVTVYSMEDWVKVYAKLIENRTMLSG